MKAFLTAAALLVAGSASAQTATPPTPLTRADAHAVIGWQNLHETQQQPYNNWLNGIVNAGAGAGWYWTDHLKTQVDVGTATRGQQYRFRQIDTPAAQSYEQSRLTIRKQSVAVSQQYQFFRNQWFHPHVGAGLDLARETTTEEFQPVVAFDPITRVSRQVSPARVEGPTDRFVVRPFVETGFKAYMSRRAFFLTDARMTFRSSIDEVLFRFGFGIDF